MINQEYKDYFLTNNKSGWKTKELLLKKNEENIYNLIIEYTDKHSLSNIPFKQKIWHFINDVSYLPCCLECGGVVTFKGNLIQGYSKFCSYSCSMNNKKTQKKTRETCLKKYNNEIAARSTAVRNKYKETCLKKYGVDNVSRVEQINKKREETILNNFGVNSVLKLQSTKENLKKYSIKNFGVDNINKSEIIKAKKRETSLNNYGTEYPMQSKKIKDKFKSYYISNFGVSNPMQLNAVKEKNFKKSINTKYKQFIDSIDIEDKIISWSGDYLTLLCNNCGNPYSITREVLKLRSKKNHIICNICNPFYKQDSYQEKEIKRFLNSLNLKVQSNNRDLIKPKEIDLFIPSHNIAIEFNGLYWHSELFVNKNYQLNKTKNLSENGIRLIHIFEDEWIFKEDIVKSRLRNIFGVQNNKIYARKCFIKMVNTKESSKFLNENHIQGNVSSKIKIGLYYNNILVSLMTFGNGRIILGGNQNKYELLRFCNKLNTSVIGGASKLLKYFIKNYSPKEIISYADRRWSEGNLYDKLGFNFVHNSQPNYFYVINNTRKHRFKYRKSMLIKEGFDPHKSEHEIMLDRNIYRIYDCGTKLYSLTLKNEKQTKKTKY